MSRQKDQRVEIKEYIASLGDKELSWAAENALSAARGYIYKNTTAQTPAFRDYLYVDSILSSMPLKEDRRGDFIICTDGEAIYFNPERLLSFKRGVELAGGHGEHTVAGILIHEALHILLGHTEATGRGRSILTAADSGDTPSPGMLVLSSIRNVAMDKEVNRHAFRMAPDMYKGPLPACGWGGMVIPDGHDKGRGPAGPMTSEPIQSFEDYYTALMQKMLEKTCEDMEQSVPRWGSIKEGERLVLAKTEEYLEYIGNRRKRREKRSASQKRGVKHIQEMAGIYSQGHDGAGNATHGMRAEGASRAAKQAFEHGDALASTRGWERGKTGDGVVRGSLENHVRMLGRPGEEGLIAGSWSDMVKQVMAGIAGETAEDDWSIKDPMSEIYEQLGFGEAVLPGKRLLQTGSLMCVLDVSGSVSDEYFLGAWMEMSSVAGALAQGTEVTFVQVDTEIKYKATGVVGNSSFSEMKNSVEEGVIKRHGWGKTDFTSFFSVVRDMERKPDLIVFFSDMKFLWDDLSSLDPGVPVLWVTLREHFGDGISNKLPFGEVYEMGELGVRLARDNINRVAPAVPVEPEESDTRLEGVLGSGYLFDIPM